MNKYTIDCVDFETELNFWNGYLAIVEPDGSEFFGKNLDAFWDALSAGGPGYPGDESSVIEVVNTESIKKFRDGNFYRALIKVAEDLNSEPFSSVSLVIR